MAVLVFGLVALSGCGSGTAKTSPTSSDTATSSASATESAAPTPKDTQPSGSYAWRSSVTDVVPKAADVDRTRHHGTWTFSETSCDASSCLGTISSSSGSTYGYRWNGAQLTVTRKADVGTQPCRSDATGKPVAGSSSSFRRSYTSAPVDVAVTGGPPTRFVVDVVQHSKITKLVKCQDSGKGFRQLTLRLVVTRQS